MSNAVTAQPLRSGGSIRAINPETFEDVQRIARAFVGAGIGTYKWDASHDQKLAQATTQIMAGLELGIPPTQAMAGLMVVNGRVSAYGEMVTGLLWAAGFEVDMGCRETADGLEGYATITRPGGKEITATFTEKQAKQAGLWDERPKVQKKGKGGTSYTADNDSPWYRFREDMMMWKALGRASRRGASDVLRGLWIREDLYRAPEMRDITPVPTSSAELPDPTAFEDGNAGGGDAPSPTPNRQSASPELPDPDADFLDGMIEGEAQHDTAPVEDLEAAQEDQDAQDEPLADQEGFLQAIEESLAGVKTHDDIQEIEDSNAELAARCDPEMQERIQDLYAEYRDITPKAARKPRQKASQDDAQPGGLL